MLPTQPRSADSQKHQPPFRVFILFSNLFQIFKLTIFTLNSRVELDMLYQNREAEGLDVSSMYIMVLLTHRGVFCLRFHFRITHYLNWDQECILCLKNMSLCILTSIFTYIYTQMKAAGGKDTRH